MFSAKFQICFGILKCYYKPFAVENVTLEKPEIQTLHLFLLVLRDYFPLLPVHDPSMFIGPANNRESFPFYTTATSCRRATRAHHVSHVEFHDSAASDQVFFRYDCHETDRKLKLISASQKTLDHQCIWTLPCSV